MAQLTLSKSTYLKEARKLANYKRYLPSLDLKRQQLMLEKNKARIRLLEVEEELQKLLDSSAHQLQMLGNEEIQFADLVVVEEVDIAQQNLMGVNLPKLNTVHFKELDHGYLTQPHWVDLLVKRLRRAAELRLSQQIHQQRLQVLTLAVRKATQRVNLVAKVLIPETQRNMRKISIFLADNERAAVVRSKLAKKKKQAEAPMR